MMNIAWSLFRELLRNRILSLAVFFGIVLILFSVALSALTLGDRDRLVLDFGLAMMELVGVFAVVYVGSQILLQEIAGRTVYLLFSKPLSRAGFILGKVVGFSGVLALVFAIQGAVFSLVLAGYAPAYLGGFFVLALAFAYLKLVMLFAIVLFFSVFCSPMIAMLVSLGVYVVAHASQHVVEFADLAGGPRAALAAKALAAILPNFYALDIKSAVAFRDILPAYYVPLNLAYSLAYLALVLAATILLFQRKTFEN